MSRISLPKGYKVQVVEYERGWGSKVDESIYFDNEEEAKNYVTQYNKVNTAKTAPDWYMIAKYCGQVF